MKDNSYKKEWSGIDSLILEKGLPKSALKKVNALYTDVKNKGLKDQVIKALLYRMSLEEEVNDQDPNVQIALLQREINATEDEVQKSVLQVILANAYQTYLSNYSWKVYQRSNTVNFKKDDIATWNANDFEQAVTALYRKALQPAQQLQKTALKSYSAIILKGNVENLRPTLYDLLAHKILDYYKDVNSALTQPAFVFELKEAEALATSDIFIKHHFNTQDTSSHLFAALNVFQQLLQFHKNDKDPEAFIDVDLERIVWVNAHNSIDNSELFYRQALEEITKLYPDTSGSAQAWYLRAAIDADKASKYQPFGDTAGRFGYINAKAIIDERLKIQAAASEGRSNMQQLLASIVKKELHAQVENINVPDAPFRMYVSYRNVETVFIRIIDAVQLKKINRQTSDDDYWKQLAALPYIKMTEQKLPLTGDYQQHSTEIKIEALSPGSYAILASGGKDFKSATDKMFLQPVDISNVSFINNGADYFVLNRETGQPMKDVNVKYELQGYDYNQNKYVVTKSGNLKPDVNGFFTLYGLKTGNENNIALSFSVGNDKLEVRNNNYYFPQYNSAEPDNRTDEVYEKENSTIFFFTDRSIYRPGQTVFFKGIGITKDRNKKQSKLLLYKDSIAIKLKDVNGKEVDSIAVTFNEYGSFSGKFTLPSNLLTGEFSIMPNLFNGNANFSVEEYKRPKFYVEFDTLKSTYRLNDTIKITGQAKAYAGNNIDGAQVKFNVQRNTRFMNPWMFWRSSRPVSRPQQITQGMVTTDADGKFELLFIAKPDATMDKNTDPVFDFSIEANITDINGETRDGNTSLSIGFKSLQLQLNMQEIADVETFKTIAISAQNLSGQNVPTNIRLAIYPLQTPEKLYRKRRWEKPDLFAISKEDFEKDFPYDEYADETDYHNWTRKDAIITDTFNTKSTTNYQLQSKILKQGWYAFEATAKDKDGNEVKDIKYVQLYDLKSSTLPSLQSNWQLALEGIVQPGQQAKLLIGTNEKNAFVIQNIKRNWEKVEKQNVYSFYQVSNNKNLLTLDVNEEDRNGAGIYYAFVKHNRFYTGGMDVQIPWLDKQLQINYTTFRNKTEPGSKEKWTVQIKGEKGEKTAAELLTGMYDASLDQFKPHAWNIPPVWQTSSTANSFNGYVCFGINNSEENYLQDNIEGFAKQYDELAVSGDYFWNGNQNGYFPGKVDSWDRNKRGHVPMALQGVAPGIALKSEDIENRSISDSITNDSKGIREQKNSQSPKIQPRKNFNETAFFFPQLYADSAGNYSFSFTIPEALTQWKWMSFAHTKDLAFGNSEQTITTQKTLMVQPNMPRFLREGDQMEMTTKISNLSDTALTGEASLELIDALTNQPVDGLFQSIMPNQYFTVEAGRSAEIKFPVNIPFNYNKPLTWRITAKAGNYADGEENTLPVLTNRMLVTETLPLYIRGDGTKEFKFEKLLKNSSSTLSNESITVEYTPNPVWYAVQALPYLMEYKNECAEQLFNTFYANAMAAYITAQHPRIKEVFEKWRNADSLTVGEGRSDALLTNLEKNQELKQVLLQETPWVLDAANETQQKKNIALLFDVVKMSTEMATALQKLKQTQMDNGAFPWFKGGYADRYITQYILTCIGRLIKLNAIDEKSKTTLNEIVHKALNYLDEQANKDYAQLKNNKVGLRQNNIGSSQIQYLFMRSYFPDVFITNKTAYNYYYQQSVRFWNKQSEYMKAMIGVVLYRTNMRTFTNKNIIPSILENAVIDADKGMYWKNNKYGYYWYQSPIEQQALMIELMNEMAQKGEYPEMKNRVNDMRTWLLLNKQTNNWKTTKATADACYALLLNSDDELNASKTVEIKLDNNIITPKNEEAGTGYFKQRINGAEIKPAMGNIAVSIQSTNQQNNRSAPSWGAVYWQYFEDLDKITSAATPLSLAKKLFVEKNTASGKVLSPVNDGDEMQVGDKIIIRLELRSDRDMEYLQLKDMRAAAMEPTNVLSGYKWQDGLGYYEATKDASTSFFIGYLNKGTYVFEYPVYLTHTGTFSAGIATIQCMYAPEFSSHSEGIKIQVAAPTPK